MATAVLYIAWDNVIQGREKEAYQHFSGDLAQALDAFQAEGYFESRETIALTAYGRGPRSITLLFGERAKLDELRRTDAFERVAMTLGKYVDNLAVVPGLNQAGIDLVMQRVTAAGLF